MEDQNPTNPKVDGTNNKVGVVYIICAAFYVDDGKKYHHQPKNIEIGLVICGRRHHNCIAILDLIYPDNQIFHTYKNKQGFLTSDNRFVDREEAGTIAFDAKQTAKYTNYLYSEDLY